MAIGRYLPVIKALTEEYRKAKADGNVDLSEWAEIIIAGVLAWAGTDLSD